MALRIDEPSLFVVLAALYRNEDKSIIPAIAGLPDPSGVRRLMRTLTNRGFVDMQQVVDSKRTIYCKYTLTEKGMKFVERLSAQSSL